MSYSGATMNALNLSQLPGDYVVKFQGIYTPSLFDITRSALHTGIYKEYTYKEPTKPYDTPYEMIKWMHDDGLPISIVAEILRVERKSVYSWLKGGSMKQSNQKRLETLYSLLFYKKESSLQGLYRFWNRSLKECKTLGQLLVNVDLDPKAISDALEELWPIAKKYEIIANNKFNIMETKNNPFLAEIPEVTIKYDS